MNAYAPPEIREPAPVTITVRTDTRDRALVVAYMKERSLRKVARQFLVSTGAVSGALDRFGSMLTRPTR